MSEKTATRKDCNGRARKFLRLGKGQDKSSATPRTVTPLASQESNPNLSDYPSIPCRSPSPQSQEPNSTVSAPATTTPVASESNSAINRQTVEIPGRSLWDQALAKLSKEEQRFVLAHSLPAVTNIKTTLESLRKVVESKRETCEEKRWVFNLNGQTINLSRLADKVCVWLDKFKGIGDVVVNVDPLHAGIPWAAIRLLLQAAISEQQQMEVLLRGLDTILYLINKCEIYDILYLRDPQPVEATEYLESALVELYAVILRFLTKANRLFGRSTSSRAFHASLNPNGCTDFEKNCQSKERRVQEQAEQCERLLNRNARANGTVNAERLKTSLQDIEKQNGVLVEKVTKLWDLSNAEERRKILQWTSDIACQDHHNLARSGRTSDTGEWLLGHKEYKRWRSASVSMILWLHGIPGAGKTKLVSKVVDDFTDSSHDEVIAYFYCDRNQEARRMPENILRSFVKQLAVSPEKDALHRSLTQIYYQKAARGFNSKELSFAECEALLIELIETYKCTTLIVDALDECHASHRRGLIEAFDLLISKSTNLKILISSRRDDDIKRRLEQKANVGISATDNQEDIGRFVADELEKNKNDRRIPIPKDLQEQIIQTLLEKSGGMFQWASLQIHQLLDLRPKDIRIRLGKLPENLKEAYDEIYETIQAQKGSKPAIAERAFQWIMCSFRPLSPEELVAAVCQDPDNDDPEDVDITIDVVLGACQNLLDVDENSDVCRFAHLSIQEYFEQHYWNSSRTNGFVAKVCLLLLNHPDYWKKSSIIRYRPRSGRDMQYKYSPNNQQPSDLLQYARNYWPTHVQNHDAIPADGRLSVLLKRFLGSMNESGPAYQSWYTMLTAEEGEEGEEGAREEMEDADTWLYNNLDKLRPSTLASFAICMFGFNNLLPEWWELGFTDIEQRNEMGDSLIVLGAVEGSYALVTKLLSMGANVNAQGEYYGTALQAASTYGHDKIVELLLSKGADVNAQSGYYGNALQAALTYDYDKIVELLLSKGADVNAQGGYYGTALHAASTRGHDKIVELLLSKGADVNAQGGYYGTALQAVSGTALQAASYHGHDKVVELLLSKGADVNTQGGEDGNALQAASRGGYNKVVELLLVRGADVNAQGGRYGNALQTACGKGYDKVVELLLSRGADVNTQDGVFGNALQEASSMGYDKIVELLLSKGADVNAQGNYYGTALQAAIICGHDKIVELLLSKGADVNAQGGYYGNAL